MKEIIRLIDKRAEEQNENPFIQWLKDDSIPPKTRLTKWLLGGGFFISGFRDLNSMILGYPDEEAEHVEFKRATAHNLPNMTCPNASIDSIRQ